MTGTRLITIALLLLTSAAGPAAGEVLAPKVHEHQLPAGQTDANFRGYRVLDLPGQTRPGSPLVVYLHGGAGPQLEAFTARWWPALVENRAVVAVPQSPAGHLWPVGSDAYVRAVVADAQKRYRTDPNGVILLGSSGGGQLALFLADRDPNAYRAVVALSTNPVVVRDGRAEWFFPPAASRKNCPYFVACPITQGAALQYWRQVQRKTADDGASISLVPVLAEGDEMLPPPKGFPAWLEAVLDGKHPEPLPDPQKQAVAEAFAPLAEALAAAAAEAEPLAIQETLAKAGPMELTVARPGGFERSAREADRDANGVPLTEIRIEHQRWPIYVRANARWTARPMGQVIAAEQRRTAERGLLYQVYRKGQWPLAGRKWTWRIGTITFPDKRHGWRTTLFVHAASPLGDDGRQWLEVVVMEESQKPQPKPLARLVRTLLQAVDAKPIATPRPTGPAEGKGRSE